VGSLARDGFGAVEIAEMLSADAPAVSSAVVAPPTDQTALRDRIAEALMRWTERGNSPQYAAMRRPEPVRANAYSRADAVLAVLPPSVDRAAAIASCPGYEASPSPCRCPCCGCPHHCGAHNPDDVPAPTAPLAWVDGHPQLEAIAAAVWEQCGRSDNGACVDDDPRNIAVAALSAVRNTADDQAAENKRLRAKVFEWQGSYLDEVKVRQERDAEIARLRADRAAVLREAADRYDRSDRIVTQMFGHQVAAELRRLADETPDGGPGCAHCGNRDHAWDDCEAYTKLVAADEPAAGARQDGAPDDVVTELTEAEFHDAAGKALARLGLTYAELEDQARRRDFSSAQAR